MKIIRVIVLVAVCSVLGFNMGVNGCSGQIENPALEEGAVVDATEATLDMPLVTVVNGLAEGEDPMLGDPCLMNYVPPEVNFLGSAITQDIKDTLSKFGFDNFNNEQAKQDIDNGIVYMKELVGFAYDNGDWGALVRIGDGVEMTDFINNFLTDLIESMNSGRDVDKGQFIPRVLDDSTVIISLSQEVNAAIADRVEQGIEYECAFYRINDASALNSRPMIYLVAKAKTSLLDEPLSSAVPEMQAEIQKSMAVLGIDKQDGIFRFYFGALDGTDPLSDNVITYFSFYIDTDSYLLSTAIDMATDQLFNGD